MSDPYRAQQPTYRALDVACRKCGLHPLLYAYYPSITNAGPLCRECCIEWKGQSKFVGRTVGADYSEAPYNDYVSGKWKTWEHLGRITVVGERPNVSPWLDE